MSGPESVSGSKAEPPLPDSEASPVLHDDNDNTLKGSHSYTAYGRPLSIIESSYSASSDEEDDRAGDAASAYIDIEPDIAKREAISNEGPPSPKHFEHISAPSSTHTEDMVGMADNLEEQIVALFGQHAHDSDGEGAAESTSDLSIRIKHLPRLLDQFKRETGARLLGTSLRSQLDAFAKSNPDVPMQPRTFAEMIRELHKAETEGNDSFTAPSELQRQDSADVSSELRQSAQTKNLTDSEASSYESSDDGSEAREEVHDMQSPSVSTNGPRSSSPPTSLASVHRSNLAFPRSQSERAELSVDRSPGEDRNGPSKHDVRKFTSSDPAAPLPKHRRASAPLEGHERPVRKTQKRASDVGGQTDDREVLKGKGKVKAPPSAWARPKPQALVNRDRTRKLSDTSGQSNSQDSEYERQLGGPGSSPPGSPELNYSLMGSPAESQNGISPRHRLSSQPNLSSGSAAPSPLPRSISSTSTSGTFHFPRAASPTDGSGRRSGTVSPSLDESSYYNFSVISPTRDSTYFPRARSAGSRHSSGAGGRLGDNTQGEETFMSSEHVAALQAQVEALQRTLSEKDRSMGQVHREQRESEEYIARLQEDVESARSDLALRRKTDALNKVRENNHLDSIASLEADLTKTSGELETLRTQNARLRTDHDELLVAMERLTARSYETAETIRKYKAEIDAHGDLERQWDMDRDAYRETIKALHDEVNTIKQELMGHEEDGRIIATMQTNIDALAAELDEARVRGSSLLGIRAPGSENPTLSKRLGAELARSFNFDNDKTGEDGDDIEDDSADADRGEGSSRDSVIVIRRRRRAHQSAGGGASRTIDLTDAGCQTVEEEEAEAVNEVGDQSLPPTYDEAKLEREVALRLHPTWTSSSASTLSSGGRGRSVQQYDALAERIGTRCTHFEQRLERLSDETEDEESNVEPVSVIGVPSWYDRIVAACKDLLKQTTEKPEVAAMENSQPSSRGKQRSRFIPLSSPLMMLTFLSGIVLGVCLLAPLFPSRSTHVEDVQMWRDSNTLQVPWTGGAGQYDAAQWSAATTVMTADRRNLLRRLFGGRGLVEAARIPT